MVTYIMSENKVNIGSGNDLSPVWHKASLGAYHKSDIKHWNILSCLDHHTCRGLRLWNSRDRNGVAETCVIFIFHFFVEPTPYSLSTTKIIEKNISRCLRANFPPLDRAPSIFIWFHLGTKKVPFHWGPIRTKLHVTTTTYLQYSSENMGYNALNFLLSLHNRHPRSLPVRVSYGVSLVSLNFKWCSATVVAVLYAISRYTGPCYNGTHLYMVLFCSV